MVSHVKPRASLRSVSDKAKRPFFTRIPKPWQTFTGCVKQRKEYETEAQTGVLTPVLSASLFLTLESHCDSMVLVSSSGKIRRLN